MTNQCLPLSVVIISCNEELRIAEAIESACFADEVLVLDSGSTDKTCDIAQSCGAKLYHQSWLGYGPQKNKAVSLAKHDWVFVLDSDERITPALQQEIIATMKAPACAGYYVPRLSRYFGRYMKTCGLYPDYTIRLYDRQQGAFSSVPVHESVVMKVPKVGYLKSPMLHLAYETIDQFIFKQNKYSSLSRKPASWWRAMLNPYWTFIRLFVFKKGFMDGWHGFVIAKLYAQYTFWKYIKAEQ